MVFSSQFGQAAPTLYMSARAPRFWKKYNEKKKKASLVVHSRFDAVDVSFNPGNNIFVITINIIRINQHCQVHLLVLEFFFSSYISSGFSKFLAVVISIDSWQFWTLCLKRIEKKPYQGSTTIMCKYYTNIRFID